MFGVHLSEAAVCAITAAVCTLMAVSAVASGTAGLAVYVEAKRSEEPRAFWFIVGVWALGALLFGCWAVVNGLRGA